MASFTTRVELHGAVASDYENLHQNMAAQGFSRIITADDGKRYWLPPAEYNYEAAATRAEVLVKAKAAASQAKTSFAVIVTEAGARTWYGLKAA